MSYMVAFIKSQTSTSFYNAFLGDFTKYWSISRIFLASVFWAGNLFKKVGFRKLNLLYFPIFSAVFRHIILNMNYVVAVFEYVLFIAIWCWKRLLANYIYRNFTFATPSQNGKTVMQDYSLLNDAHVHDYDVLWTKLYSCLLYALPSASPHLTNNVCLACYSICLQCICAVLRCIHFANAVSTDDWWHGLFFSSRSVQSGLPDLLWLL